MISVFLVDDHQMFRQGLYSMLNKAEGIEVVGEACDGQTALKEIEKCKPDQVLLDIALPSLDGLEITRRLSKSLPNTKILILSMHADRYYAVEALKAGALGYLLKEESFTQLMSAIQSVRQGKIFISPSMENLVLKDFVQLARKNIDSPAKLLTDREREILQLLTEGKTNQQIADTLFISSSTVDTHRKNIMGKLDIHGIAGLVKYAIRHKIVAL